MAQAPIAAEPSADIPSDGDKEAPALERPLRRRVLVVDDNEDAAASLATLLELDEHETAMAYNGLDAVTAAASFQPDVVLLDLELPELSGYEVARRIRAQAGGDKVLLVALTGWARDQDREKTRAAGFDVHMVKPIDMDSLTRLLETTGRPGEFSGADSSLRKVPPRSF